MGTPPPIELASLGMADSLILMVLALVVPAHDIVQTMHQAYPLNPRITD